jgi:predicted RNase H-like nuclease (RuvC/YqgF family)
MHPQELSIELPSQGARRATEEGSTNGWQKPQRFSARQKTEVVLRLLRGEPLDLLSRELGIPAARLTTWREAFLDAGQEALKKIPLENRDRELGRLREKLGESTMEMELLREKLGRLETSRPLRPRRSRR